MTGGKKHSRRTVEIDGREKVMSVMFVPHTPNSELAKNMRSKLELIEKAKLETLSWRF